MAENPMLQYLQAYMAFEEMDRMDAQLELQRQAQMQQAEAGRLNAMNILANIAQNMKNPEALIPMVSGMGVGLRDDVSSEILAQAQPSLATIRAGQAQAGLGAMDPAMLGQVQREAAIGAATGQTGAGLAEGQVMQHLFQNAGLFDNIDVSRALGRALVTRMATGQDLGGFAASQRTEELMRGPQGAQAARVAAGLEETEAQRLRRILDANIATDQIQLGVGQLNLQDWVAKRENARADWRTMLEQMGAGGMDPLKKMALATEIHGRMTAVIDQALKTKGQTTEAMRRGWIEQINQANQMLRDLGYNTPPDLHPADDIFKPGGIDRFMGNWGR